jgi:hypothetical protein
MAGKLTGKKKEITIDRTETNEFSLHIFFFAASFSFTLFSLILWLLGSRQVIPFSSTSIIDLYIGLMAFIITCSVKAKERGEKE